MKRTITTLLLTAVAALAPAAAARADFSYMDDGKVTMHEAHAEVADLLNDKPVRASIFRASFTRTDGSTISVEDPAVKSTLYKIVSCTRVSRRTVDCAAGVSAFTTKKPGKTPYRFAIIALRVHIQDRNHGVVNVTKELFGGAEPQPVN